MRTRQRLEAGSKLVEAVLAEGDPDSPDERLRFGMDRNLETAAIETKHRRSERVNQVVILADSSVHFHESGVAES